MADIILGGYTNYLIAKGMQSRNEHITIEEQEIIDKVETLMKGVCGK